MPLTSQDIATICVGFGSAIIGGTLAFVASYWTQQQANAFTIQQRKEQHERDEKSRATRALVKLMRVTNDLYSLNLSIVEMLNENQMDGHNLTDPWKIIRPIAGVEINYQRLEAGELSFLFEGKGSDLVSDIFLIEARYGTILHAINKYNELRETATSGFAAEFDGAVGSTAMTPEMVAKFEPYEVQMNTLIGQVIVNIEEDMNTSKGVLKRFVDASQERFGFDNFPSISFEESSNAN